MYDFLGKNRNTHHTSQVYLQYGKRARIGRNNKWKNAYNFRADTCDPRRRIAAA